MGSTSQQLEIDLANLENILTLEDGFITAYTSGSTGEPKPIQLSVKQLKASATSTLQYFQNNGRNFDANSKALLCLPIDKIGGIMVVVRARLANMQLVSVIPSATPLKGLRGTFDLCSMTPMQVSNSLDELHKVKNLLIGGGAISNDVLASIKSLNLKHTKIWATYGMTETVSHIALKPIYPIENASEKFQILPGVNIRIDKRGCLAIKTAFLKEEVITNDLASITKGKYLEIIGRVDNIINSGGIKINPEEVEQKLSSLDNLKNRLYAISYIDDIKLGQKLVLVVEGQEINDLELFIDSLSLGYLKPREVFYIKKLPVTETGKIQRKALKETLDRITLAS